MAEAAAYSLSEFKNPDNAESLIPFEESESAFVRRSVLRGLKVIRNEISLNTALSAFLTQRKRSVFRRSVSLGI